MVRILFVLLALFTLPAAAQQAVPPLEVELDSGKLLQLNSDVRSVFIANPEIADVQMMTSSSLMVFGRRAGETMLVAVDEHNRTIINRRVVVGQNVGALRDMLKALIPDSQIDVTPVPGGIVLSGDVRTPAQAEDARRVAARFLPEGNSEVINRLAVSGPTQVMLRVRVAEMLRTVNKEFGVNWEAAGNNGGAASFVFGTGDDIVRDAAGTLIRPGTSNVLLGNIATGGLFLDGMIDALAEEGMVTILAEPSLTAISGETASFLAGGEFPVPIPSDDGIQIEYRAYGVSLSFTPTLIGEDRINLRVRPEVSQLSSANEVNIQGSDIPSLITRRADTTVELGSGQSFAIAGLLQNNSNQSTNKFPFLGDMPVLGALFKSEAFTREESELVIIVTPFVVRPSDEKLKTPIDTYDVPGEGSRILLDEHVNEVPAAPLARLVDEPVTFFVE